MAQTPQVTYTVDLVPENSELIDQLNGIFLKGYKPSSKPTTTAKPVAKDEPTDDGDALTLDDVKTAAKAAKKDHGEDFAIQVLKDHDVAVTSTLGRSMGKIPEDQFAAVIAAWEAGPQVSDDDGLGDDDDGLDDDDDDGLGDDTPEVTAEAVKTALKAYSKEVGRTEAKDIMTKNGAKALSDVDDCSAEQLAAMMKAMV